MPEPPAKDTTARDQRRKERGRLREKWRAAPPKAVYAVEREPEPPTPFPTIERTARNAYNRIFRGVGGFFQWLSTHCGVASFSEVIALYDLSYREVRDSRLAAALIEKSPLGKRRDTYIARPTLGAVVAKVRHERVKENSQAIYNLTARLAWAQFKEQRLKLELEPHKRYQNFKAYAVTREGEGDAFRQSCESVRDYEAAYESGMMLLDIAPA